MQVPHRLAVPVIRICHFKEPWGGVVLTWRGWDTRRNDSGMDNQQESWIAGGLTEDKEDAWRALYDAYSRPVWQYVARRMPPDPSQVADVVQETFLAAARSARQFDAARGSLANWLYGIARNHVALHFRRQHRRPSGDDDRATLLQSQILEWLDHRHATPPEALATAETALAVRAALAALPAEYEALLVAKYFDENSVDQIAGQEKSTPTAIRSKLARARQAFRRAFEFGQSSLQESCPQTPSHPGGTS